MVLKFKEFFDPPKIDLRQNYDDVKKGKKGEVYIKGKVVQIWWYEFGEGGAETWTLPTEQNAIESFERLGSDLD